MFDRMLVPLDGSELATCVLPYVAAMTQALGSTVTLLHVLEGSDTPDGAVNPVDWQLQKIEAQSHLDTYGTLLGRYMAQPPSLQVIEGSAAKGIIDYAQSHDIDLIALSSHGHSGLNGWNINSVVQKVIDRARKSILLVRAYQSSTLSAAEEGENFHYRRILAPLDGSQRAESVLPLVIALARYHNAELLLVHVVARPELIQRVPPAPEDAALVEQVMERNRTQAIQYFATLQTHLPLAAQLKIEVGTGGIATTLHRLVEEFAADLVVLSAHGHSGQRQRPYGNVTTSFLAYGTTPLLILQDLPPHEILPSKAERLAEEVPPAPAPRPSGSDD